jgi:hypothetical protein
MLGGVVSRVPSLTATVVPVKPKPPETLRDEAAAAEKLSHGTRNGRQGLVMVGRDLG